MNTLEKNSKAMASDHPASWAQNDDEISLLDLFDILRKQWRWIAGFSATSAIIALAVCIVLPKQYQANVLIQIGKIANANANANATSTAEVESPQTLIERINSDGFQERFRNQVDMSFEIKAIAVKNTKLIRLEGKARSAELAKQGLEKSLEVIAEDHKFYREEASKLLATSLQSTRLELKTVTAALSDLNQRSIEIAPAKSDPVSALLLTQTQQQLNSQRATLADKVAMLEASENEQNLAKTAAVEPIIAGEQPVFPKTVLVTIIALLGGGFMGVLVAFLRNAIQNRNK